MNSQILHKYIKVDDIKIFYREAGHKNNPSILLLHGFPSSSVMFKSFMTSLSDQFHLVAPDYPGFGFSEFPDPKEFEYSFAHIAFCIERFVEKIGLYQFYIYLHDYGSTIGLRVCLKKPKSILGLIVQNGNAYEDGLGPAWEETKDFWAYPTWEKKQKVMSFLTEEGTKSQYTSGLPNTLLPYISPDLWTLDWTLLSRPGNLDMQMQLNEDYKTNMDMFDRFQAYFRNYVPPALILWGKYDPFFSIREAYCYQKDLPRAKLHILEGGHMALETNFEEIVFLVRKFIAGQK